MNDKLWIDEAQRLPDNIPLRTWSESDTDDAPMSPNQANKDILTGFGYPTADTVRRAQEYHSILTDLIAELRRTTKGYLSPRAYAITVEQQREMADAAEAQLREAMRNDE